MDNKLADFIFTKVGVPRFEKYLNLGSLRHKLIGGNISNVSTPGYEARDINFQEEYKKATGQSSHLPGLITHQSHLPLGQHPVRAPRVNEEKVGENELNSVDIDREISTMAQNELRFTVAARLLQRKFEGLKDAITSK